MTEQEKQLLLKDICTRLSSGVKGAFYIYGADKWITTTIRSINPSEGTYRIGNQDYDEWERIKPYLRPMSSMTEEETEEYRNLSDEVIGSYGPYHREFIVHCVRLGIKPDNPHECVDELVDMDAIDWLNANHFDYRGLIKKGLALEAPEGMYND